MMFLRKIEWEIKLTTRRKKCTNVVGVSSTHKICTRRKTTELVGSFTQNER